MRLDTTSPNIDWQYATKEASLLAKPACLVITDPVISKKLLLETLEGEERLGENAVICIGPFSDAWQQSAKKLLAKYTVDDITNDGWMVCKPKDGNLVCCIQITDDYYYNTEGVWHIENMGDQWSVDDECFHVRALWGQLRGPVENQHTVQYGQIGDWVLVNAHDPSDVWIVKEKIFKNTYKLREAK